jgi:transglutaminase-like putative cysteine protease
MTFKTYFESFSYATIAVATLTLFLAGGLSLALALSLWLLMVAAWKLEATRWQLSERAGLVVVLCSIPLFFLDWKLQQRLGEPPGRLGVNALAHLIVFLSAVKLFQFKKDRDWVFLYLISFFEVLLAAGLSFSPVFLGTLALYLLCGLATIVAFEIQKARQTLAPAETKLLVSPDARRFSRGRQRDSNRSVLARRLPLVAVTLLLLIFILALPLFLVAPRSGAAAFTRGGGALTNFIGFSENVTLGEIGTLKGDNSVVMHVRIEDAQPARDLRWRGVALDEFTGRSWKKSAAARHYDDIKIDKGYFQVGTPAAPHRLTAQTVFLESIESPVLFAAPQPIAIQGDFPLLRVDNEGSIQARRHEFERAIYTALSDTSQPEAALLRRDNGPYSAAFERYWRAPAGLDPRIEALANAMVVNVHARNRYDEAKAIESQLQANYAYSLEMRATGPDPLADFLFHVKTGHCEYFSTAMAMLLRTRGIAVRVVNGFLPGEYNEAAGAYTVRQSDAHSWVEVYFPENQMWITFDPTPAAGKAEPLSTGITAQMGKYAEALELIWLQYVVGYDKQEQRSLATSLHSTLFGYRRSLAQIVSMVRNWFAAHTVAILLAGGSLLALLLVLFVTLRVRHFGWRRGWRFSRRPEAGEVTAIVFYKRLLAALEGRGVTRGPDLTPLEFASGLDFAPALAITRAYNRVRFGGQSLSPAEQQEIEQTLTEFEKESKASGWLASDAN